MVGKSYTDKDIPVGATILETAGGEKITVAKTGEVKIASSAEVATVTKPDVMASNGVIHIVDTVF